MEAPTSAGDSQAIIEGKTSLTHGISVQWPGFKKVRYLVVFGDSYCALHGDFLPTLPPIATDENPLGFPPDTPWSDGPNWVAHLVASTQDKGKEPRLLVYDYAIGGSNVLGVEKQVYDLFIPNLALKPPYAPWASDDTLFVFFVGINDCASSIDNQIPQLQGKIFTAAKVMYKEGARNFMFINLPPIDMSPALYDRKSLKFAARYLAWNVELEKGTKVFQDEHPDASVFVFSAYSSFYRIMTDPESFGLSKDHAHKACGEIWVDHLHPSSAVHKILAKDIEEFLEAQDTL